MNSQIIGLRIASVILGLMSIAQLVRLTIPILIAELTIGNFSGKSI